jgi:predicted GNAT superfamily acetyltransferase
MKEQSQIEIREIERIEEFRAAEELQKEVWGFRERDVVPLNQLRAAKAVGGVLIGAFDDAQLVGFVYGFVGLDRGRTVMHSHMLAVKVGYRGRKLGYQLKLAQRQRTLELGVDEITWTFDPLLSLNAYLNFQKLGVIANRYEVDFYGPSASSLHQLGTDRLWVNWKLVSPRVSRRVEQKIRLSASDFRNAEPLVRCLKDRTPARNLLGPSEIELITIEIPVDINVLQNEDTELARHWREVTREAFLEVLQEGFRVEEFFLPERKCQSPGTYVLVRKRELG